MDRKKKNLKKKLKKKIKFKTKRKVQYEKLMKNGLRTKHLNLKRITKTFNFNLKQRNKEEKEF